jgi:predicted metal-dependent phosphoesterase TrpH
VLVDFHCHTLESDGTLTPVALAAAMRTRGVEIFSVTDHDSLGAYKKLADAGHDAALVTGVELNTTYRGNEVHVLGYNFPVDSIPVLEAIANNREQRRLRAQKMAAQLTAAGYELSFDEVRTEAGSEDSALGRPHVARALIRKSYARDIDTAFREFLTPGKPGYVAQTYLRPQDAVALIAEAGGVAVLAHPGRLKDESIVEELVLAGLTGIETFYPTHDANMTAHFRALAAHYGLVMTAGSDFHDARYNARGVGMDVAREDIAPFLDLVR